MTEPTASQPKPVAPKAGDPKAGDPKPAAKAAPKLDAHAAVEPEPEAVPAANAGIAALLNTSLGDLLVAGLIKDPEDAGRVIAAAISQAAAPVAAAPVPPADADRVPEAAARTPPASAPKTGT